MDSSKAEGKRSMKDRRKEEEDDDAEDDNKKKRALTHSVRKGSGGGSKRPYYCQVEDCPADMSDAKPYHRRHKVCEYHAKAPEVVVAGVRQRFCQQCSRLVYLS